MKTMTVSGSGVRYLGGGATTGNATTCSGEGGVVMETTGGGEGRVVMDTVGGLSGCPCLREEGTPVVFDLK